MRPRRKLVRAHAALAFGARSGFTLGALVLALCVVHSTAGLAQASESDLWGALRSGGHVALLRHALAPGTGDPAAFRIDDCATQRNLSAEGRKQAEGIGDRFRENAIDSARVVTSQWCRCRETAELLRLGPVTDLPILNSFFQNREGRAPQTRDLRAWLQRQDSDAVQVLVTHQVNISALTGVYTKSGELVILRIGGDGALSVVGSIETD